MWEGVCQSAGPTRNILCEHSMFGLTILAQAKAHNFLFGGWGKPNC